MLTLENLSFDVPDAKGEKGIIKQLSLTIEEGKFVVITGPNGGGKSTLAKLIAGIEKPTEGRRQKRYGSCQCGNQLCVSAASPF